jgi:hypothetical protein
MIRPLTLICLMAAFGSGLYLYAEKHRAILLDRQIAHAIHGTEAARERTGLLRAEWALLNDPGRLQDMADRYLALKPMAPGQFVQLADLSSRLPPPAPPGQAVADDAVPAEDAAAAPATAGAPVTADAVPVTDAALAPASAAVDQDAPAVIAKAPVHAASKQVAHAVRKPAHPVAVATREPRDTHSGEAEHDGLLARGTPLPLAGLPQARPHVMSAMARPARVPAPRPAVVSAYPAAIGSGTYVGSALGGAGSLPPPVPLR